ncbi:hypothetical protein EMCRGX_G032324 [Ephydatia muelleri]
MEELPSASLPNLTIGNGSCEASEVWVIPELAASPTVNGREIRHFFSILSSESNHVKTAPQILPLDTSYRLKVLHELYESERTYVCNLATILEALLDRHTVLLAQFREQTTSPEGMVGEIFCSLCCRSDSDLLSIYCAYFNEFTAAMKTLVKYERSPVFCEALQACQPHCKGLSLAAFLLTPVQRLPRYELLLKEILKYTPKSHADLGPLETALGQLKMQMLLVNNSIRSCQMSCLRGMRRSSCIGPHPSVGDPSRYSSHVSSHRRTHSHNELNFSLGTSDSNDEDCNSLADSLTISCSDLTLDFKDTSPSHARSTADTTSFQPYISYSQRGVDPSSQPKITIGSPVQFRHVKHAIR